MCSFIPASVEPRAHLAPMRAAASRCLSLIHGRWTASAAIPLPPFYIAYLSKKHSAYLPAPTALPPTDKLCRDPIFLSVGRILQKKCWPSFASASVHLHYEITACSCSGSSSAKPSLIFPLPLLSLRDYQFYLKCHKPSVPRLYGRMCAQITTIFPPCVVVPFSSS